MRELKREADQEIREKAYIIVEELIQLYKMTNPQLGYKSEDNKLENARVSISLFWELFDLLGYWAQCQIIAYKRSTVDSEFTSSMIEENEGLTTDSHALEEVGDSFLQAMADEFSDPDLNYFESEASHMSRQGRYSQLLRLFLFEMLASQSAESHPWRFRISEGPESNESWANGRVAEANAGTKNRGSVRARRVEAGSLIADLLSCWKGNEEI